MPTAHIIVQEGDTGNDWENWIAEVHSITPYCLGAHPKDKKRAQQQLANAHLIAAAPDLLECLIETLAIATRNEDGEFADRARAAISKAQGHPHPTTEREAV